MGAVGTGGGHACVGTGRTWETSVLAQVCCEPKTALNKEFLFLLSLIRNCLCRVMPSSCATIFPGNNQAKYISERHGLWNFGMTLWYHVSIKNTILFGGLRAT